MKKLPRLALLLLLFQLVGSPTLLAQSRCSTKASPAQVQQLRFLVGQWQGHLQDQGSPRTLQLHFREQSGQIMATVQQAGQLVPLTAQASLCALGKFHFFGVSPTGESFRYNARLQQEQLIGSLSVGNACATNLPAFTLRRAPALP